MRDQNDHNRLVLALSNGVESTFTESDWKRLGYLTNTIDQIRNHSRLLRSLSWNDPDYGGHVLDFVEKILQTASETPFREFEHLADWLAENEPWAHSRIFGSEVQATSAQAPTPGIPPWLTDSQPASRVSQPPPASAAGITPTPTPRYDVALSFAGEDRESARTLAAGLRNAGVHVFFDEYEKANLWGKDLYQHLADVYTNKARYCIIFVSAAYSKKLWTNHELRSAQARAFRDHQDYLLPLKMDDTRLPGVPETIGYIDWQSHNVDRIVSLVVSKLKAS